MFSKIRKNRKKYLGIFGAALMVAFLIQMVLPYSQQSRGDNSVVVKFTGGEIRYQEVAAGDQEWNALTRYIVMHDPRDPRVSIPIAAALLPSVADKIDGLTFLLLVKEAQQQNMRASEETLAEIRRLFPPRGDNADATKAEDQAIRHLLMVYENFQRMARAAKVAEPVALREASEYYARMGVNVVDFTASSYLTQPTSLPSTQPTDQEKALFLAHRNDLSFADRAVAGPTTAPSADNPFGLGYKYPNRIKFDYLAISMENIENQIKVPERAIYRYYRDHSRELPKTTQPASAPATQAATQGATRPFQASATKPVERTPELSEARDDIRKILVSELADDVRKEIARQVSTRMQADHAAWQAAVKNRQSAPIALEGVTYNDSAYLYALAYQIKEHAQETYNALYEKHFEDKCPDTFTFQPSVSKIGQWASTRDIQSNNELKKVAGSMILDRSPFAGRPFAQVVMSMLDPFLTEQQRKVMKTYALWELLPEFTDLQEAVSPRQLPPARTIFLVRITEADPSRVPADMQDDALKQRVRDDARLMDGYAGARADAEKFLADARQLSLQGAANKWKMADGRLVRTGDFGKYERAAIDHYSLPDHSLAKFKEEAFKLMDDYVKARQQGGDTHPMRVIELPLAGKVVVAEFEPDKFDPLRNEGMLGLRVMGISKRLEGARSQLMAPGWFAPDAVKARLNVWVAPDIAKRERPEQPQGGNEQPIDPFGG